MRTTRAAVAHATRTHRLGAYADATPAPDADGADDLVIPEDLTALSDDDLQTLHTAARGAFESLYGDGKGLSDDDLNALSALTDSIGGLAEEVNTRETAAAERDERAAVLARQVDPAFSAQTGEDETETEGDGESETEEETDGNADESEEETEGDADESAADTVTASARRRGPVRISMSGRAARHLPRRNAGATGAASVMFAAGEGSGYANGQGIDFLDAGKIVDKRLGTFNARAYESAAARGRHMRQQMGVLSISKPIPDDLMIDDRSGAMETETVLRHAASESRLQGNSLVASGGWCAPSETLYDLLELETRDGIFSAPEVGVRRGGLTRTLGPNFGDIYNDIEGFHYTEAQDIAADYDGEGGGSKPCVKVDCPDFEEFRLEVDGLCITAGLLQQKGYPEVIARTLRGALIAHDHRLSGRTIRAIETGSTPVSMASHDDGSTSPLLDAIEKQVEHVRYTQRLSRTAALEAVFPFWVRGVIRSDLSRRQGVDYFDVNDARINAWFTARGIAPQFVYNWQDINPVAAGSFVEWPNAVKFLLYPSGTWIRGTSDVITVDSLFDSTQLGTNDFTALFTEEGWMVVRMGHDSRVVTVPLEANGVTHSGLNIDRPGITLPALSAPAFPGVFPAPTPTTTTTTSQG